MADDIKDVGESNSKLDFDGDDVVDLCCSVALAWIAGCAAAVHVGLLCGTTFSVAHALANDLLIVARKSMNSSSRTAVQSIREAPLVVSRRAVDRKRNSSCASGPRARILSDRIRG